MIDRRRMNLFETIRVYQHDLDFEPHETPIATAAPPGSLEKIRVMCERLSLGQDLHHPNDMRTAASMELQHEMATAMIAEAKAYREASRVKRAEAQPKRESSLHAARVTKQRIAEARKVKTAIRTRPKIDASVN
jgi:hypothetical protein